MNEKSLRNLKPFSKDRQPPNENKRGIRWKSLLRKKLEYELDEMYGSMIAEAKKGNVQAFEKIMDRAYGKVPNTNNNTNKNMNMDEQQIQEHMEELKRQEMLDEQGIFETDSKGTTEDAGEDVADKEAEEV